jgi:hypothetical protein
MATEKTALGSEFASWTALPEGPLGQALSAAKNVAIGYGIQESGLQNFLNGLFGKKNELPADYTPSAGVMPTPDYGMQAPMQEAVKPPSMSYGIQPPSMTAPMGKAFKPFGLPNTMTSMNSSMPQTVNDELIRSAWNLKTPY